MSDPISITPNPSLVPEDVRRSLSQMRHPRPQRDKRIAVSFDSRYPTPFRAEVVVNGSSPSEALAALREAFASAQAQLLEYAENDPETAA